MGIARIGHRLDLYSLRSRVETPVGLLTIPSVPPWASTTIAGTSPRASGHWITISFVRPAVSFVISEIVPPEAERANPYRPSEPRDTRQPRTVTASAFLAASSPFGRGGAGSPAPATRQTARPEFGRGPSSSASRRTGAFVPAPATTCHRTFGAGRPDRTPYAAMSDAARTYEPRPSR